MFMGLFFCSDYNVLEEANIEHYTSQLQNINEAYDDKIDSRLIVRSDYKVQDDNAISVAAGLGDLHILQYSSREEAEKAGEEFKNKKGVKSVEFDRQVGLEEVEENSLLVETKSLKTEQGKDFLSWGADILGVKDYQNYIRTTHQSLKDVYVVVIDTGIDTDHEFLRGRIAVEYGKSFAKSINTSSDYQFEDDNGHGTHVAGTIVDLTLENVKIVPVKALSSAGFGALSGILSAMEYSVKLKQEQNLNVVATNMSLGGAGEVEKEMKDFIDQAYQNNILTVVAAGNSSYYAETEFPGASSNALTISALSSNSLYQNMPFLANYSNYGAVVDLCLPGTAITSCVPNEYASNEIITSSGGFKYVPLSGTSMATPHASALVALIATNMGDEFSAQKVEQILKENAYDFGDKGKDDLYGYGVPYLSASIEDEVFETPNLSFGEIGKNIFDTPFDLKITYPGENYIVKYSTDGSIPAFINETRLGSVRITQSSLIKIIVYKLDENSRPIDMSPMYEVEYLQSGHTLNDNGVGFSITSQGVITGYHSGLTDIVLPRVINGITVTKLANNVFYGLPITSFECDFDIACGDFPFWSCDRLKKLTLFTTSASKIARFCFGLEELHLPKLTAILPSPNMKYSSYTNSYNGSETFSKCFNLREIELSSLTTIPKYAFSGYLKLENIILDWENLKEIQAYSFHNTKAFSENITAYAVENIEEYAFSGSGIVGFNGKKVETAGNNVFENCNNLRSIQLPVIKSLGSWIISGSGNLQYIMIGPYLSSYNSTTLKQTDANMKIYCYNKNLDLFNGFETILLNPDMVRIDAAQLQVNLTGYDLNLKVYKSEDDNFSQQDDTLIKDETFSGINVNAPFILDELFMGRYYYIFILTDRFGEEKTLIEEYLYEAKQSHKLTINSNVDGCGIISPKSYYTEGEEVIIVEHELDGYSLMRITLNGQEITIDGRYTFLMPDEDVVINVEYTQIQYSIDTVVEGEGTIIVKDENGQEIDFATFGQKVYVEFIPSEGFYLDSAFVVARGLREEITRVEYFTMPCADIKIMAYFLSPKLKDFEFISRGEGKIGIRRYKGSDEYIYIPQYHIMNGQKYRVVSIAEGCFFGNTTLKSISMEFEDDNIDIEIEQIAFSGCTSLERVALGRIVKIYDGAFRNCQALSIIDLSECREIGDNAFNYCSSLKQINLKSCTIIGKQAFYQSGLTKVTGFKVESVPESAFAESCALELINLSSCISIEKKAFQGTGLKEIDLSSCLILGEEGGQFQACLSLEIVKNLDANTLPTNIFAQCYSLKEINLDKVKTIRKGAFDDCMDLSEINLKSVEVLEKEAIENNAILRIYLDDNSKILTNDFPQVGYVYIDRNHLPTSTPIYYAFSREFGNYIVYTHSNAYIVTFKFDGATIISKDLYCTSDFIIVPKTYEDDSYLYTLQNWYVEGDNMYTIRPEDILHVEMDTTYVAKQFTTGDIIYNLIYYYGYDYDNSGEINDEGDVFRRNSARKGEHIILPDEDMSRTQSVEYEYTFEGWTVDGEIIDENYVINGNLIIVAKYKFAKRKYTVSWLNRDGSVIYSEQVEYGTTPHFDENKPLPQNYRDEFYDYIFDGWGEIQPVQGNVNYYPTFRQQPLTYHIYFYYGYDYDGSNVVGDDGDIFKIVDFNINSVISYPLCSHSYEKEGMRYLFKTWEKSSFENLSIGDIVEEFDENLILKLNATYFSQPIQYTITWIDGDGNVIYSENYTYNQVPNYNMDIYGTPSKQETKQYSYQFIGWEPEKANVTCDAEYRACFNQKIKTYTVTWINGNGEVIYQEIVEYGTIPHFDERKPLPSKATTSKLYYKFTGWDSLDLIEGDTEIKPIFETFNVIKSLDQTTDMIETNSILGVATVRIEIDKVDKTKSLKVKIDNMEILLPSNLLNYLGGEGAFEVTVNNKNLSLGRNYKNVKAFSINMKLRGEDYSLNAPVSVTINRLIGYGKNARVFVGNEKLSEVDFELKDNTITFELSELGFVAIANKSSMKWIFILSAIAAGVIILSIIVIICIVKIRKRSNIFDY